MTLMNRGHAGPLFYSKPFFVAHSAGQAPPRGSRPPHVTFLKSWQ